MPAALRWLAALLAAAALLYGRYDWADAGGRFARNGYVSTLYFVLLVVPLVYALMYRATGRRTVARAAAGAVIALWTAPLHWLRLDRFRALTTIEPWSTQQPHIPWLPSGWATPGAPHERALLVATVVVGAGVALAIARRRALPIVALLAAIAFQTALHTSLRSPYSYTPHFEKPGNWYHAYLIPPDAGAANKDVVFFTSLDEHFNGAPREVRTLLLRRSFVHWLAAPFTYFWNPFYVYLVLNTLLWLAASVSMFVWARRLGASPESARLAAALVACGNGFVYFVAQPMSYLAAYAVVVIALALFEVLVVDQGAWLVWGGVFGLCAAVYDLFPMMPVFALHAWLRGASVKRTVVALGVALAVPLGFIAVERWVLGLELDASNAHIGTAALAGIAHLLRHEGPAAWLARAGGFALTLGTDLLYGFFIAALLLGVAGLAVADRAQRRVLLAWYAPSVLLVAYLYFGGVRWGHVLMAQLPRLSYGCYPSVYLGAALLLARVPIAGLRWAVVAALFVLVNVDVLGFPDLHYHFYWPTPLECDPYSAAW